MIGTLFFLSFEILIFFNFFFFIINLKIIIFLTQKIHSNQLLLLLIYSNFKLILKYFSLKTFYLFLVFKKKE